MSQVTKLHTDGQAVVAVGQSYATFDQLASRADYLVDMQYRFAWHLTNIKRSRTMDSVERARREIESVEDLGGFAQLAEQCRDETSKLERLQPDGDPLRATGDATKRLVLLTGCFPTSNVPDPAIFSRMLVEEVVAAGHGTLALESACRKLRREQRFMPSISEVLAVLAREHTTWTKRLGAIDNIGEVHGELVALADEIEAEITARDQADERRRAAVLDEHRATIRQRIETGEPLFDFEYRVVAAVHEEMRAEAIAAGRDPEEVPHLTSRAIGVPGRASR